MLSLITLPLYVVDRSTFLLLLLRIQLTLRARSIHLFFFLRNEIATVFEAV